jgi:GntR family transcriptional regulator, transcriptional repressor for pyruvate dehydrogenase complex
MVSAVNELLLDSRRRTMTIPGAADKAVSYHLLVALAIRQRDGDQARAVMEQHVRDVARDAGAIPPEPAR